MQKLAFEVLKVNLAHFKVFFKYTTKLSFHSSIVIYFFTESYLETEFLNNYLSINNFV